MQEVLQVGAWQNQSNGGTIRARPAGPGKVCVVCVQAGGEGGGREPPVCKGTQGGAVRAASV